MVQTMKIRRYSELIRLPTFLERFNYLKIGGSVGVETFGFDRYLNQAFYHSSDWNDAKQYCIIRDNGCDLAMPDHDGENRIIVHHMNPISEEDIYLRRDWICDPEFLITTFHNTHNAIHYSNEKILPSGLTVRQPNDTCPWK